MRGLCPSLDNMAREMNRTDSDKEAMKKIEELDRIMLKKIKQKNKNDFER